MQILNLASIEQSHVEGTSASSVLCGAIFLLGYFDGVHLGHRALIDEAKKLADGKRPIVIRTFDSLPKSSADAGVITTNEEKCEIFASFGVDAVIFDNFNNLKSLSGEEFFTHHIAVHSPYAVVCGFNFRFGHFASCDVSDLKNFAQKCGIICRTVNEFSLGGEVVSSTVIRGMISSGNMIGADRLLGHPYSITSEVIHGKELGRTIGHPTINQRFPAMKVIPPHGVYSCTAEFTIDGKKQIHGGVCNIGSRPTVNDNESDVTVETYIFDFSCDLYGLDVKISFTEFLRPEKKFTSIEELSHQIETDEKNARMSLNAHANIEMIC